MFEGLSDKLNTVFAPLKQKGTLNEQDIRQAMADMRLALLEADVALPVVRTLIDKIHQRAKGEELLRSVTPGQQIVKIVHDELVATMTSDRPTDLQIDRTPPAVILLAGLQGTGKTTTAAKLAKHLQGQKKRVLLAGLDVTRPAAYAQLHALSQAHDLTLLPKQDGQEPPAITHRALQAARLAGHDVLILDTAGRTTVDEDMLAQLREVAEISTPAETLLVVDASIGQDAVNIAKRFGETVRLSGLIMSRMDGDARGGGALSMSTLTGMPIKFIGTGEGVDDLQAFDPDRTVRRILGMGDVVGLVEKAQQAMEEGQAEALAAKIEKGKFTLEDMASQLRQMRKMGGMRSMLDMLPAGLSPKTMPEIDESLLRRQEGIICSMTKAERRKPVIIHAKRRQRIAKGAGVSVADVNRLLKQHRQMSDMLKRSKKMGARGGMPSMDMLRRMR
ncbi:MAG: signal recognition particle protein [Pseudomonadota bacterium]